MSTDHRSKVMSEALHRVTAARWNIAGVLAGTYEAGVISDEVLRLSVGLLDQAAEWMEKSE